MGHLRLILSLTIMCSHLAFGGNAWSATPLACFYVLSGYSITASGIKPGFWARRFWRLWPSYVAIAVVTHAALWLGWVPGLPYIGQAAGWDAIAQFFMLVPFTPYSALVPTAWMIKWLLLSYLLMWLGASRTPQNTAIWLLLSFIGSFFFLAKTPSYAIWYAGPLLPLLATSLGAACYHLGLVALRDGRWASFAGALSYPVFLTHYGIGAAMASITGLPHGWPLFWLSIPPTLCMAWLLVLWIEQPIARYRKSLAQ